MPPSHLLLSSAPLVAALSVAAAGFVTGLTGFGFALVSVPLLMLALPPTSVAAVVLAVGEIADLANVLTTRRHVDGARVRGLLLPATVGMVAGVVVLRAVQPAVLRLVAATAVVVFTGLLLRRGATGAVSGSRWRLLAGWVSGLLATTVGLSGPPVVLFLDAVLLDKHRSRATLAAYFAVITPVGLALVAAHGGIPAETWRTILVLTPVALLGRLAGSRLHRRTPPSRFRAITLTITLVAGVSGVLSALAVLVRPW